MLLQPQHLAIDQKEHFVYYAIILSCVPLLRIKEQEVEVYDTAMDGQFTLSARSLLSTFGIVQKQTACLKFLEKLSTSLNESTE